MEFKLWLENRSDAYSWLSPTGEFHTVRGLQGHLAWAQELLNKLKIKYEFIDDAFQEMFKLKWQRITYMDSELMTQNELYPPNFKQKQALIDLAIVEKFDEITYFDAKDEITIWTAGDII